MCGRRLGSSRYYNISYLAKSSLLKNLLTILPASLLGYRPNRITRMSPLMSKDVLLVQLSFYLNCMSDAIFHKFSIGYCNLALYFICIVWTYVVCTLFVLLGSGFILIMLHQGRRNADQRDIFCDPHQKSWETGSMENAMEGSVQENA